MRKDGAAGESASVFLFGRKLFWNDKCDDAFVERVVVRVLQFKEHFVRTGGKTHQDDWVTTRICPAPWGIVDRHMKMSDARRDSQSIWAEHGHKVQVLSTILDNRHSPGGERFGQRRIDDDLCWRLFTAERDNRSKSTFVRCVLCHSVHCAQHDGSN